MAIQFETRAYEFAHGRKPRGFGMWAFEVDHEDGRHQVVWAPRSMQFSEAKAWMRMNLASSLAVVRRVTVAS